MDSSGFRRPGDHQPPSIGTLPALILWPTVRVEQLVPLDSDFDLSSRSEPTLSVPSGLVCLPTPACLPVQPLQNNVPSPILLCREGIEAYPWELETVVRMQTHPRFAHWTPSPVWPRSQLPGTSTLSRSVLTASP